MVSSLTSMRGGWYVCTIETGRELLLCLPVGLSEGESFTSVDEGALSAPMGAYDEEVAGNEARFVG